MNVEAERSVLGSIMLEAKAIDEAAALGLVSSDFSLDSHRKIFSAMQQVSELTSVIDTITLPAELSRRKELEAVGGYAYISGLLDGVPDRPSIKHYVKIVREKAAQRKVMAACNATVTAVADGSSSQEAIGQLGETILQIQTGTDDAPAERVIKFSDAVFNDWEKIADGTEDLIGLTTGIDSVDRVTTGIRPGETWALGGRSGDGKTAFALQIAAANCRRHVPVGYFSIEMCKSEVLQRLWSHEGKIPFAYIRNPRCASKEMRVQVQRAMGSVGLWPLFVAEDSSLSLQKLVAKARLLIRQEKLGLLIVDYVQQIDAIAPNERERLTKISNQIRALAKDTGVPVVAVSQLNRPKDRNQNERPNKFSMKESGSLENDAHTVLLIYRPMDDFGRPTGDDEIIIAKQRHGPVGNELVRFDSRTMTFFDRKASTR
ncbi:MAG: DnaB-like helicase C-terminal domain-containing protein [Terriglobales bacterium]